MKSRWKHQLELHSPFHGHQRVAWIELFYDLIFVASIIQLGNALAEKPDLMGFLGFFALFIPIWFTWTGLTFYSNRFVGDDFGHRALVFWQMYFVGSMAVCVHLVFEGDTTAFSLSYALVRIVLVLLFIRAYQQVEEARDFAKRHAVVYSIGAAIWLVSAFVDVPWVFLLWAVAIAVDLAVEFSPRSRAFMVKFPPDVVHMSERYGLLTIIVLGEAFVKVLSAVAEGTPSLEHGLMGGLSFSITVSLWWLYFDDVAASRIRSTAWAPLAWIYTHLPLTIAVTAVGVGIKKVVFFDPFVPGPAKYRWLLCGTVALAFVSMAIIDQVTERAQSEVSDQTRPFTRLAGATAVLVLAMAGGAMPSWLFIGLVSAVCVAQVFIDMLIAPHVTDIHALEHDMQERVFGPAPIDEAETEGTSTRRWDITEAIRRGTPSKLKRDLYFFFMEGSWTLLLGSIVAFYLLINGVFAALYMLEAGAVSSLAPDDFIDAFAFSVQTMSTIGYGTMSPQSDYAHLLVTIQATIAVLFAAVATGVIFAKIARPKAGVLFSEPVLITQHEGERVLMFRVGNARGNEIVEAAMKVVLLSEGKTAEGRDFRSLTDLELVRETSPTFALTWTVMHRIDASSPLYECDAEDLFERDFSLIATLTGYDSTYAQTTHKRHIYYPENFRFDHQFVDVISKLDDGRLLIDYDRFHGTQPLEESSD